MMLESPQLKMLEQLSWKLRSRRRWATCQHVQHGQQEQEEHHKTACECRKRCEIKQQSHEVENRLWFVDIVFINEPKLSKIKGINTVLEAVPVWSAIRYISDTGQYWCTVSGLLLFFIFINIYIYIYMYVCMYVCMCVYIYYNKYKSLP